MIIVGFMATIYIYICLIMSTVYLEGVINQVATWVAFLVPVNGKIKGICSIEHLQWKSLCEISIKKFSDVGVTAMGINRQRAYCPTDRLHCPIRQRRMLEEYDTGESLLWKVTCLIFEIWQFTEEYVIFCWLMLLLSIHIKKNYSGLLSSYRVAFKW